MRIRFSSVWGALCAICLIPMIGFSLEEEDARNAGCLPKTSVADQASVCVSCHQDALQRWASNQYQPCTPYCISCHKKSEMDRHHSVGTSLPDLPENVLTLTSEKKIACITCHDLSRTRYDRERWKATSLFDRLFHKENRYNTYFLVMRNDRGQLCLACH